MVKNVCRFTRSTQVHQLILCVNMSELRDTQRVGQLVQGRSVRGFPGESNGLMGGQ